MQFRYQNLRFLLNDEKRKTLEKGFMKRNARTQCDELLIFQITVKLLQSNHEMSHGPL